LAFSGWYDEASLAQVGQLLRYVCLALANGCHQMADILLTLAEYPQNLYARWVRNGLDQF
jgi:hypothetical protein